MEDLKVTREKSEDWNPDEIVKHAAVVSTMKEKQYEKAGRNIVRAQEKDNKKHSDLCSYTKGTLVWIRNSARESKKGDKLNARWLGPYAIEEDLRKGVYRVSNASTGHVLKKGVNQSRHHGPPPKTKPHSHRPPPGDVPDPSKLPMQEA